MTYAVPYLLSVHASVPLEKNLAVIRIFPVIQISLHYVPLPFINHAYLNKTETNNPFCCAITSQASLDVKTQPCTFQSN